MKTNWLLLLIALFVVCCSDDNSTSGNDDSEDAAVIDDEQNDLLVPGQGKHGSKDGSKDSGTKDDSKGDSKSDSKSDSKDGSKSDSKDGEKSDGGSKSSEKLPDEVGPVEVVDEPVIVDTSTVSTADELPKCTADNEGESLAVGDEKALYFCVGGEWVTGVVELFGVTCSDGVLKLNENAAVVPEGTLEEDSLVTYRRTGVNLVGTAEKGPFLHGTTVKVIELDSMQRLADSKRAFETCVSSTDGSFAFENANLISPYVRVEATGYYRNELTGGLSSSMVTLNALTDLTNRDTVNVNMLTHLAAPRVRKLVEDSGNNQPIGAMGARALNDVLSAFEINLGGGAGGFNGGGFNGGGWGFGGQQQTTMTAAGGKFAEDVSLFGGDDYSGALLAVSIMMQSNGSGNDMLYLTNKISEDIKGDGNWGDNNDKAKLADWLVALDISGGFATIRKNMSSWNQGEVPEFEKHLRNFWTKVHMFETCSDYTAGQVKHIGNSMSQYFVSYYEQPDGPRIRFICDKETKTWREATDLEKDTYNFGPGDYPGQIRNGVINTDKYYVYDQDKKSWRAATSDDIQEFVDIKEVYSGLASDEKVIFILRHAERGDDTSKKGHLTTNGKTQSQSVGAKFKGETFALKNSTYTRSYETCENIAIGAGLTGAKQDTMPVLDGEWYVKDETKFENYKNTDGGGWVVASAYAYKGMYSDAFYDLDDRSEEFISDVVKPEFAKAGRVSIWVSHDMFVAPFTTYCTNHKANLRYFDTKQWINYLAGVAIIMDGKGNLRYVPVKGIESGTMTL